ncbi:MAG TPA: hypothetical protein VGD78_08185, partial [Chthoniobacterales bacterium]
IANELVALRTPVDGFAIPLRNRPNPGLSLRAASSSFEHSSLAAPPYDSTVGACPYRQDETQIEHFQGLVCLSPHSGSNNLLFSLCSIRINGRGGERGAPKDQRPGRFACPEWKPPRTV